MIDVDLNERAAIERLSVATGKALFPNFTLTDLQSAGLAGRVFDDCPDHQSEFACSLIAYMMGVRDIADFGIYQKAMQLKLTRVYSLDGFFKKKWTERNPLWVFNALGLELGADRLSECFEDVMDDAFPISLNSNPPGHYESLHVIHSTERETDNAFAVRLFLTCNSRSFLFEFGQWDIVSIHQDKLAAREFTQSELVEASKAYITATSILK